MLPLGRLDRELVVELAHEVGEHLLVVRGGQELLSAPVDALLELLVVGARCRRSSERVEQAARHVAADSEQHQAAPHQQASIR